MGESEVKVYNKIKTLDFSFPEEDWAQISDEAKKFVLKLMKNKPEQRPSAAQAIQDPWISQASEMFLAEEDSEEEQEVYNRLRNFKPMKRL